MTTPPEPVLAPPGAGLPKPELFIARMLFAFRRWTGNRKSFDALFNKERDRIRELVRGVDGERGSRRVLIRRVPGLEDSSRFWSIWMTLDHLRLVHMDLTYVFESLAKNAMPSREASTAAVKPSRDVGAGVLAEYEATCDKLMSVIAAAPNLKKTLRFPHPWFGPLDGAGWHALAGTHLRIHRIQIERILAGLSATEPQAKMPSTTSP